jgi:hypothetical protein
MTDDDSPSLKDILFAILTKQHALDTAMTRVLADLETIQTALWTLSPDPKFSERLADAIQKNRDRFAEALAVQQAENSRLLATVSKTVQ